MTLEGRHVLVTGAARGLGAVLARTLADAGARLILADIAEEEGRAVAADINGHFLPVDLADPAYIDALGQAVGAHTDGVLHGLVNNGAVATNVGGKTFEQIDIETWDRVMGVNVRGTWLMVRAMAPLLRASGSGRIVNVASDTALWGAPKLLSRELGPDGVGVTAIAPGILTTPSTDYVPEARHRHYADGRAAPGSHAPEEVAGTVTFLLGEDALSLTGQVLPVNKGFVFG